jgi:hypothetical protein
MVLKYVGDFGFFIQMILGCFNTMMIYHLGHKITNNAFFNENLQMQKVSLGASLLYCYSQTLIYSVSSYSEVTFTFF